MLLLLRLLCWLGLAGLGRLGRCSLLGVAGLDGGRTAQIRSGTAVAAVAAPETGLCCHKDNGHQCVHAAATTVSAIASIIVAVVIVSSVAVVLTGFETASLEVQAEVPELHRVVSSRVGVTEAGLEFGVSKCCRLLRAMRQHCRVQ